MESQGAQGVFLKIKNAFLIVGGLTLIVFGVSRLPHSGSGPQVQLPDIDGIAHADAPSCSGDSGNSGDSSDSGGDDDGGC